MKNLLLLSCFSFYLLISFAQTNDPLSKVVITSNQKKTRVLLTEEGKLYVNVSPKDMRTIKERGWVLYSDLGAKGNGKADDIVAIAGTHAFANQHGLKVKADDKATYFIGGKSTYSCNSNRY